MRVSVVLRVESVLVWSRAWPYGLGTLAPGPVATGGTSVHDRFSVAWSIAAVAPSFASLYVRFDWLTG